MNEEVEPKEEIEEIEDQHEEDTQEVSQEAEGSSDNNDDDASQESTEEQEESQPEDLEAEKEKREKEEAFLQRRREKFKKQEEERAAAPTTNPEEEDRLQRLERAADRLDFEDRVQADRVALSAMEKEYAENVSGYSEEKEKAINVIKKRLVMEGMSEAEALNHIEIEMLKTANQAYLGGKDPVEVIHQQAKHINQWVASVAEEMGFQKTQKKVTNSQALRDAARPNPMTGGLGRSGAGVKRDIDDIDDAKEIADIPLREFYKRGA